MLLKDTKKLYFQHPHGVTMNNNYSQTLPYENEFISKGVCATNPTLSALQEVILIYLKELSYYLLKLKDFGANNERIKEDIIQAIGGVIANVDYNQEQFQKLIFLLAEDLSQAKIIYVNLCKKNSVKLAFIKGYFKHTKILDLKDIIKKSEVHYIERNIDYSSEQKNLFNIMLSLIKNICVKTIQLQSYKKDDEEAYTSILKLLNAMNFDEASQQDAKALIETSTCVYSNLTKNLSDAQEEAHGKRESVYISFAPRTGKAILVSGIDMTQLEAILEATKGKKVDVYTHGLPMLMAHTLSKFRTYPNLVGHFGQGCDNSLFDFAAFPGAILTTRYLFQKVEYLYRGRLFTTDPFAPSGIVKIKDNNFNPLIQAALESKGFTKKEQDLILRVGFKEKEMEEKVQDVIGKMKENKIQHLYILGLLNSANGYKEYFDKFLKIMPKNCYALSLAFDKNADNILHVDSLYDYLFINKVLEKINIEKPLESLNITIFITKCDQYTISNIINFKNMGIKNIYLCKCIPTLINPALVDTMREVFGIKEFSTPEEDIKATLAE